MDDHKATPIEDKCDWRIHFAAKDAAIKAGACFQCATEIGFAAVEKAHGTQGLFKASVCAKCVKRGVKP